ncbi:hypothetical protein GCM10027596_31560 [Nocardioides korecus]
MLRVLIALGLMIDAVVHLRLAGGYQLAQPQGIGQGNLFRLESAVALLSAVYVLLRGTRTSLLIAAGVGASAFIAVVLTRYVSVPSLGPIPPMYEPVWFLQKTISAVAEGLTAVLALVALRIRTTPGATTTSPPTQQTDRHRL